VNLTIEAVLVWTGLLLLASILASKISAYLGIPRAAVVPADRHVGGIGRRRAEIYFDDAKLSQFLGVMALSFILFSGGLDTKPDLIRPVLGQGLALSTLGVLFTALFCWLVCHPGARFSLKQGLLLGAIVSSTDAAAVFAVLRGKMSDSRES